MNKDFKALLSLLNKEQIDALIQEEQLKKQGYKFFFVIDSTDLHNYAYPLGLQGSRPKEVKKDFEYITDEQIALYTLFNQHEFKAFILDEHFDEVAQLIDHVKIMQSRGEKLINNVQEFAKELKRRTTYDLKELLDNMKVITENISFILSMAVGLQADGVDKLYKLQSEKKLLIDDNDLIEQFEDDFYVNTFNESKNYTNVADIIFDYISKKFLSEDDKNPHRIINRKISYYRDCQAIDRILSINEVFHKNNKKQIILFLSSDYKTSNIFYYPKEGGIASEAIAARLINIEKVGNAGTQPVNYLRKSAQIFLRLLCEENTHDKIIDNLENAKKVVEARWESNDTTNATLLLLNDRYDKCRREFEDNATILRIGEFKKLTDELNSKQLSDFKEVPLILNRIIEENAKNIREEELRRNFIERLRQLSELHIFRNAISMHLNSNLRQNLINQNFQTDAGKDYIFGSDHHLPTIFHFKEKNSPKFTEIASHYLDKRNDLSSFIEFTVMRLFIDAHDSDELILKRCQLLLMLNNLRSSNFDSIRFATNYKFEDKVAQLDFDYMYCWALRREERYEEADQKALNILQEYPKEPRFHHALALSFYCQYEKAKQQNIKSNIETLLKQCLIHVEKALIGYEEIKKESNEEDKKNYISKNIFALLNTEIYVRTLLYVEGFADAEEITKSRTILQNLKHKDHNYYFKPEFLHTESFLEYQEYKVSGDIEKLEYALEAVESALELEREYYLPLRLKQMCLRLRDEIVSVFSYIKFEKKRKFRY